MDRTSKKFRRDESGAVAIYVAIGLMVLMGFAALALDIAHMVSVKRELNKAAEAGALAGARGLWPMALWQTSGSRDQTSEDWTRARTAALNAAMSNIADGTKLALSEVTVEIGKWDYTTKQFTAGNDIDDNACRVTTRKAAVRMFLAQILGISSKDMSATATALMDFIGSVGYGTLPIVLNKKYTDVGSKLTIYAGVATEDNGGWFTVPPDVASAQTLSDYINNPDHLCPPLEMNEIINLQNGQDTSFLQDLKTKLNQQTPTGDPPIKFLDCVLPVVDTNSFNQDGGIIGFVPFRITSVKDTGNQKNVSGTVLDFGEVQNALPGGGKFGALAPPKLVQ
jgi:Flp pilus assembly protein TadG